MSPVAISVFALPSGRTSITPGDDDAVLRAQSVGAVEHTGIAEHDLDEPGGVAEVDEDHPTVVAAPGHPARQGYLLAGVGGPQRTGGMTAQH